MREHIEEFYREHGIIEEDILFPAMHKAWEASSPHMPNVNLASGLKGVYCIGFRRGWSAAINSSDPVSLTKSEIIEALINGTLEWNSSITKGNREETQADRILQLLATGGTS